jgi:hypothetical protein
MRGSQLLGRKRGVSDCVLNVAVSQVGLQHPRINAVICELVAASA